LPFSNPLQTRSFLGRAFFVPFYIAAFDKIHSNDSPKSLK
jgi:hypothetical protein